MKKIIYKFILSISLIFLCACSQTESYSSLETSSSSSSIPNITDDFENEVSIDGFDKIDYTFNIKLNNEIDKFSFINKVHVPEHYYWSLFYDIEGTNEIKTKTIKCDEGNNVVYMLVENDNQVRGFYTINVYRFHIYHVIFNTGGGSDVQDQYVQEQSLIASVDSPNKKGYTFLNWDYDFNEPVTSDLIINALWQANEYHIIFDPKGGSVEYKGMNVFYGEKYTLPKAEKSGYEFEGWYYNQRKMQGGIWDIDTDCVLVAKWNIIYYSITYHLDGGYFIEDKNPSYYTVEDQIDYFYEPLMTGYSFEGWYVDQSFNTPIHNILKGTTGNFELYAKWRVNHYKVTVYNNDNQGKVSSGGSYIMGSEVLLSAYPNRGYIFEGWYIENDCVSKENPYIFIMPANDIVIQTNYICETYTIEYCLFGGNNDSSNPTSYTVEDDNLILKDPSKYGYSFMGWHLNDISGNVIDKIDTSIAENITLYAEWQINTFDVNVICDASLGLVVGGGKYAYNSNVVLSVTELSPTYKFIGWFMNNELLSNEKEYSFIMPNNNVEITLEFDIVVGSLYYFGKYPQSEVLDSSLLNKLNALANNGKWISYDYYSTATDIEFAFYQDVEVDGELYRGVIFVEKRITESTGKLYYGKLCEFQWFKYEKLEWIVLNKDTTMILTTSKVIDSQEYDLLSNVLNNSINYENSYIYKWLNSNFLETAFIGSERSKVKINGINLLSSANFETYRNMNIISNLVRYTSYSKSQGLCGDDYTNGWWLSDCSGSGSDAKANYVSEHIFNDNCIRDWAVDYCPMGIRPYIEIII